MSAWLVTFLTGLLSPLLKSLLNSIGYEMRLKAIEDQQTAITKAFGLISTAKTDQERKDAIAALSAAANS